jgi:Tfp pilus assembly protein PilX
MAKHQARSQGFILIAALLLLFLLSGIAVGVMMLTNSEIRIGGNDKESNMAFYNAESGMEKITSDLSALYQQKQAPTAADIQSLTGYAPDSTMVGPVTYAETITYPNGALTTTPQIISSGSNQGLTAFLTRMDVTVNAVRPSGASANITRRVEVALIPVFQFGVFSDTDLSYFAGPYFAFAGRVHTNGNLFPTPGSNLVFGAKITVVGEIVRDFMSNGLPVGGSYSGNVYAPKVANACDLAIAGSRPPFAAETNCVAFTRPMESWVNPVGPGLPPAGASSSSPDWLNTTAPTTFNHNVVNGRSDNVKKMVLPFVQPQVSQIEIVRKPVAGELTTSALGSSRLYNQANIRVLLADVCAPGCPQPLSNLHPPPYDANDVVLTPANAAPGGVLLAQFGGDAVAYANPALPDANWVTPTSDGAVGTPFPLIKGAIRVEYLNAAGNWIGVTNEWLALGIGRGLVPPTAPGVPVGVNQNAILRLQEFADVNGDGIPERVNPALGTSWYPINFYDPREGQVRDTALGGTLCTINGIMNAVEIDAGNLKNWLNGTTAGSGQLVDTAPVNGYLLYFSDRRGMLPDPRSIPPNQLNGEYGFEDVVNVATSAVGLPNGVDGGVAEPGEDADGNGFLDKWGAANVGDGFRIGVGAPGYPYAAVNCLTVGRANRVTGARHVLRLIDGGLGNLPLPLGATGLNGGGFTVASENPVYVLGDYNANTAAGGWIDAGHAAAGILADSVTLLSNPVASVSSATPGWNDEKDMANPTALTNRNSTNTSYRVAIAAGKNLTFPNPTGANSADWGTDGGVHNFLRYIEDWSGGSLFYTGSLVSLYTSQYATGTFKCCATVYSPPTRNYTFDSLFLNPADLPPGTPRFTDIVNLSYRQDFTPY